MLNGPLGYVVVVNPTGQCERLVHLRSCRYSHLHQRGYVIPVVHLFVCLFGLLAGLYTKS